MESIGNKGDNCSWGSRPQPDRGEAMKFKKIFQSAKKNKKKISRLKHTGEKKGRGGGGKK